MLIVLLEIQCPQGFTLEFALREAGQRKDGPNRVKNRSPVARRWYERFYTAYFNPYLNYHRPCGFARVEVADNGKRRRRYRLEDYRTPYEKLRSLDEWEAI